MKQPVNVINSDPDYMMGWKSGQPVLVPKIGDGEIATFATDPLTGAVTGLVGPGGGNVLHVLGATNGQVFGDTRYPGQLIDSLSSLSGWAQTVTGGATITTTTMKDGNPGIQFTLAAGSSTAYIDKVGLSINYTQDTTIGIWVEIPDAGRIAGINVCVSNENNAFTNWNHGSAGGSGGAVYNGGLYFIPLAISALSVGGGSFASTGVIQTIRLRVLGTYKNQGGSVKFRGLMVNSIGRPRMMLTFDDGYVSAHSEVFRYMSKYGLIGTVGVVKSLIGTAGRLTIAQCKEMYAAGWDFVSHSLGHTAWCSHSVNAICLSQTPAIAGALTYNGAVGTSTFDTPRHIVVRANDQGLKLTITGLDAGGSTITEDLYTWTGAYYLPSTKVYSKITSIVVDQAATGAIQVGQCRSEAEMTADLVDGRNFLLDNGMPRGANHFVFPQGEFNATGLALLSSLGFKSARIVGGSINQPHVGDYRKYEITSAAAAQALTAAMDAVRQKAIDIGGLTSIYLHDVTPTASDSSKTAISEFRGFIDNTATDVAAGKIECITQSMAHVGS